MTVKAAEAIRLLDLFAAAQLRDNTLEPGDLVQERPALKGLGPCSLPSGRAAILWRRLEPGECPATDGYLLPFGPPDCIVARCDADGVVFLPACLVALQPLVEAERAPILAALASESTGLQVSA